MDTFGVAGLVRCNLRAPGFRWQPARLGAGERTELETVKERRRGYLAPRLRRSPNCLDRLRRQRRRRSPHSGGSLGRLVLSGAGRADLQRRGIRVGRVDALIFSGRGLLNAPPVSGRYLVPRIFLFERADA
jgi:hypothetical protein